MKLLKFAVLFVLLACALGIGEGIREVHFPITGEAPQVTNRVGLINVANTSTDDTGIIISDGALAVIDLQVDPVFRVNNHGVFTACDGVVCPLHTFGFKYDSPSGVPWMGSALTTTSLAGNGPVGVGACQNSGETGLINVRLKHASAANCNVPANYSTWTGLARNAKGTVQVGEYSQTSYLEYIELNSGDCVEVMAFDSSGAADYCANGTIQLALTEMQTPQPVVCHLGGNHPALALDDYCDTGSSYIYSMNDVASWLSPMVGQAIFGGGYIDNRGSGGNARTILIPSLNNGSNTYIAGSEPYQGQTVTLINVSGDAWKIEPPNANVKFRGVCAAAGDAMDCDNLGDSVVLTWNGDETTEGIMALSNGCVCE